jgi:hypothetical protein
MVRKHRLLAPVDADLIAAGQAAVATGTSENLSACVSEALRRQAEHDLRLVALGGVLAEFEAEHDDLER